MFAGTLGGNSEIAYSYAIFHQSNAIGSLLIRSVRIALMIPSAEASPFHTPQYYDFFIGGMEKFSYFCKK